MLEKLVFAKYATILSEISSGKQAFMEVIFTHER
jgi:hypothetical protein